jgi:uncharacterized protein YutE (UPF0331/DUF86 family)
VVDPERLHRILRRITDDLAVLDEYARDAEGTRKDPARLGHTKYLFVTAIEGCVDAAQHVCASEGFGPPANNADAVRLLARHHLLEDDQAESVARAVGFRNVLVHGYAAVDDDIVVDALGRLDDLRRYVQGLSRLLL